MRFPDSDNISLSWVFIILGARTRKPLGNLTTTWEDLETRIRADFVGWSRHHILLLKASGWAQCAAGADCFLQWAFSASLGTSSEFQVADKSRKQLKSDCPLIRVVRPRARETIYFSAIILKNLTLLKNFSVLPSLIPTWAPQIYFNFSSVRFRIKNTSDQKISSEVPIWNWNITRKKFRIFKSNLFQVVIFFYPLNDTSLNFLIYSGPVHCANHCYCSCSVHT